MTIHVKGDVFHIARAMQAGERSKRVAIGHGCNTVGVMGAGFAALIRDRFPTTHKAYVSLCGSDLAILGENQLVMEDSHNLAIVNLFTQDLPGANADLVAIEDSVSDALRILNGTPLVIPEIGSGIGGLDVEVVRRSLYKFSDQLVLVSFNG